MNNLYYYTQIDDCLNNHLMQFSALYNHWLTKTRTYVSIPLYFYRIFPPSSMPSQKLLALRVTSIYIYECKLIEQR